MLLLLLVINGTGDCSSRAAAHYRGCVLTRMDGT